MTLSIDVLYVHRTRGGNDHIETCCTASLRGGKAILGPDVGVLNLLSNKQKKQETQPLREPGCAYIDKAKQSLKNAGGLGSIALGGTAVFIVALQAE